MRGMTMIISQVHVAPLPDALVVFVISAACPPRGRSEAIGACVIQKRCVNLICILPALPIGPMTRAQSLLK